HIYAAFQVHALYRAEPRQATITATITDQTPGIIQALLDDPRTDHDTADPARKNVPIAPAGAKSLLDKEVFAIIGTTRVRAVAL
uniref:hypothetical protein n=1 Tax=Trebonia sp. TaxID=2767075 RepID=UPI0026144134